jgi:hypothetical protein
MVQLLLDLISHEMADCYTFICLILSDKWGGKIPPFFILLFVVNLIVTKPHKKVAQESQLFHGRVSVQFCIAAPLRSLFRCALSLAHRRADRGPC